MVNDGVEDLRRHRVATSQNKWLKAWNKSRGLAGSCYMEKIGRCAQGRLIITPDGTAKELREDRNICLNIEASPKPWWIIP